MFPPVLGDTEAVLGPRARLLDWCPSGVARMAFGYSYLVTDEDLRFHVGRSVVAKLVDGREVLGKLWKLRFPQAVYAIEQPESAQSRPSVVGPSGRIRSRVGTHANCTSGNDRLSVKRNPILCGACVAPQR
jgi:hypothetical protein